MAEQLLLEFGTRITELTMIPSSGGRFEVIAGDELVYSKLETGRHAEYEDVAVPIRALF